MKRLVIHAGMAKTGTTTIQESLGGAAEALVGAGVHYPPWRPTNHSYELAALFRRNPKGGYYYRQFGPASDEEWEAERERLRERWRTFFDSVEDGTAIISAEGLEHFLPEDLEALLAFARPYFDQCMAIIYVRHPLTSIKSRWEQSIKQLEGPESPDELLAECIRRTRFGAVRRWSEVMEPDCLVVRPFDKQQFFNGGLLDDFFHSIGLGFIELEDLVQPASNTSLGHNGTAFLLQYNGQYPIYRDGRYNPERGMSDQQEVLYQVMRNVPDQPLTMDVHFSEEQAAAINRQIAFVNGFLDNAAKFESVQAGEGRSLLPNPDTIAPDYIANLANGLLKRLEQEQADRQHLGREVKRLLAQLAMLEGEADELRAQLREFLPPEEAAPSPSGNAEDQ